MIDKRPVAVARCRERGRRRGGGRRRARAGLPLAVRGGGHNVAGLATSEGGLVIDLSAMNAVTVDPERRRATVQGGAIWRDVDAATQPYGLAAPAGLVSETGVAGLTLGGGIGWLRRKYGLTCDNLVGRRAGDGRRAGWCAPLWTSTRTCCGRCAAAAATSASSRRSSSACIRSAPRSPTRSSSTTARRPSQACAPSARSAPACRARSRRSPSPAALPTGMEGVPAEHVRQAHGRRRRRVRGAARRGRGGAAAAARAGRPFADLSGRMPYAPLQQFLDEEYPRGRHYYWKSAAMAELSDRRDRHRRGVRGVAAVAAQHHRRLADGRRARRRAGRAAPLTPAVTPAIS